MSAQAINPARNPKARLAAATAWAAACALSSGCETTLGVIGGTGLGNEAEFDGISAATVLSPTTAKTTWNTSAAYTNYQVYSTASTFPIGQTIFSSFTVTGLSASSTYSFSVAGINDSTGATKGQGKFLTISTWPQFTGVGQVTASSPTSLQVSWTYNDLSGAPITGPTFRVYVAANAAPTDFTTPATSTSLKSVGISQLASGAAIAANTTYYVIVRASYLDGTKEYNSAALSATTPSNISPLPTITTDPVIIGGYPNLTVTGALSGYITAFKQALNPTGFKALGSANGNSTFRVPTALPIDHGLNTIIPTVSSQGSSVELPAVSVVSRTLVDRSVDFPAFYAVPGPGGSQLPRGYQRMGNAMASGDFNCDGYQDLAVSAAYGNFNPTIARGASDGGVYVFYGSATGLITSPAPSASPAATTHPLLLTRHTVNTSFAGNLFGLTLAAGNLNADLNTANSKACDDLAIGTATSGSYNSNGDVWVYFGSTTGLQLGSPVLNQSPCVGSICSPLVIYPPSGSYTQTPYFGYSLSIGKLHNPVAADTYQDLVIGGPYEQVGGAGRGSVFIYYGGSQGINFDTPPSAPSKFTKINAPLDPGSALGKAYSFNFGWATAAVDLDHDGIDDLVVGAPHDNNSTFCAGAGAVYYYGSAANGVAGSGSFPASPTVTQKLMSPLQAVNAGCLNYMFFGGTLANAGDINGDGFADLLVGDGTRTGQWGANANTFGFFVYYGGTTGPQTGNGCVSNGAWGGAAGSPGCTTASTQSCVPPGAAGTPGTCKILNIQYGTTNAASSWPALHFGIMVGGANAGGGQDFSGDGIHDILVGWPIASISNGWTTRADLYYGNTNGLQVTPSKLKPLILSDYDNYGFATALGNFNGDAFADAVVSAPDNMTLNGGYGGVAFVFNGQSGGLPSNVSGYSAQIAVNLSKEGQRQATIVAAGDINGDGFADAVAQMTRPSTVKSSGFFSYFSTDVIVYYGSPSGLVTQPNPSISPLQANHPLLVPTPVAGVGANFQFVGAVGDVNGDGFADIAAASDPGAAQQAYLYYGSATGLQVSVAPVAAPGSGLNPVIIATADATSGGIATADAYANWGNPTTAITGGDFNGDDFSDVAIASYTEFSAGAVLVIYGSAQGIQSDGALTRTIAGGANVLLSNPCTGTVPSLTCKAQLLVGANATEYFGTSVAAVGDVNGDGYGDLLVGAPRNSVATGSDNGVAYLFYGAPSGLMLWNSSAVGLQIAPPNLTGGTGRLAGSPVAAAGDVNGDGFADFILGSTRDNAGFAAAGGAYLFYGCGNGLNSSSTTPNCPVTGVWGVLPPPSVAAPATVVKNGPSCSSAGCQILYFYPTNAIAISGYTGNYWGTSIGGVGDVNQDGHADVAMGGAQSSSLCTSPGCSLSSVTSGAAVLFTGSAEGLVTQSAVTRFPSCTAGACSPYWATPSMTDWGTGTKPAFYNYSIGSVWNGARTSDFNADGYPDFLTTAPSYSNGARTTSFAGGFYVFE